MSAVSARSPAARSSGWSSSTRTNAEPTITPSAYDATSAAWSPLLTPRPDADGQVGPESDTAALVRATSGPARSLVVARAPVTPMTAVA